jgi:hypothetical protein
MSRRDSAIVAWHEVPGIAPPQKSRPVGYGLIRAGVRTDLNRREIPLGLAAPVHTVPYGTVLAGGTLLRSGLSLRDALANISQPSS